MKNSRQLLIRLYCDQRSKLGWKTGLRRLILGQKILLELNRFCVRETEAWVSFFLLTESSLNLHFALRLSQH